MKQFFRQPMTSKITIAKNRLDAFGRAAADEPDPAVPDGNPLRRGRTASSAAASLAGVRTPAR